MSGGLRVAMLGGLGEFGLNAMALESADELLLVDCGLFFPGPDQPGVGVGVPDFRYLLERRERLKGVVLTHGHEDHLGALPWLLGEARVPVYGTRLTLGLAQHRLDEAGVSADLREVRPREPFAVGDAFTVEPLAASHSIPDGVGLAIRTGEGLVVHSGDFKLDGAAPGVLATDLERLRALGDEGVLCLFSDSTNAEVHGRSGSEARVALALERLAAPWKGRVVFSLFASNLARVQEVLALADRLGRKVALVGRSLERNVELASSLGLVRPPPSLLVSAEAAAALPRDRVMLLATGSQAEPRSGLRQLLGDETRNAPLGAGDLVVLSARTIPGNARAVATLIDRLWAAGARVVTPATEPEVHVSGHACRDELRELLAAVRPRNFVPVHGELRHLQAHAELAGEVVPAPARRLVARDGDLLSFSAGQGALAGRVPFGRVFLDKWSDSPVSPESLDERSLSAETGLVTASVVIDRSSGKLVHGPMLEGRGLSADELAALPRAAEDARTYLLELSPALRADDARVREELVRAVRRAFRAHTQKRPTVWPLVSRI